MGGSWQSHTHLKHTWLIHVWHRRYVRVRCLFTTHHTLGNHDRAKHVYLRCTCDSDCFFFFLNTDGRPRQGQEHLQQTAAKRRPEYRTGTHLHHIPLHYDTLQHTAVKRRPEYCTGTHSDDTSLRYDTLQHTWWCTATHCNTHDALQQTRHAATHCSTRYHAAPHCNTLQHTTPHCSTRYHTAPHCTTLQHTTPHCNTLHHTAMQQINDPSIARVEILERQFAPEFTVYNHCEADFWEFQTSKQLLFGFEAMEFMKVNTTFRCVGVSLGVRRCLSLS